MSRQEGHSDEIGSELGQRWSSYVSVCLYERWSHEEEVTSSCLRKLADVCKVSVVEDGPDAL